MSKNSINIDFHIYAGTVRGGLVYSECKKTKKPVYDLKHLDGEITALQWGTSNDEILLGNKNGTVRIYNSGLSQFMKCIKETDLQGKGPVTGLGILENKLIIGRKDGTINIYNSSKKKTKNDFFKLNLNEDATMDVLVFNEKRNIVATGGENNDLKLWDLSSKTDIFKAKSLGKDTLELPIATSIKDICFLPATCEKQIAVVTKQGMLLLYDERAQRRPVKTYQEPKASFTTIASYRDKQCLIGTTKGYMQLIDVGQSKSLKTFPSCAGSVTGITCDPNEPYVVLTSLDKHLRIFNVDTKELVYKEYMKIGLNKVLMRPLAKKELEHDDDAAKVDEVEKTSDVDEEYEDIFENMETVNDDDDEEQDDEPEKIKRKKIKSKVQTVTSAKKRKCA